MDYSTLEAKIINLTAASARFRKYAAVEKKYDLTLATHYEDEATRCDQQVSALKAEIKASEEILALATRPTPMMSGRCGCGCRCNSDMVVVDTSLCKKCTDGLC